VASGVSTFLDIIKNYETVWGLCLLLSCFDRFNIFKRDDFSGIFINSSFLKGKEIMWSENEPSAEMS